MMKRKRGDMISRKIVSLRNALIVAAAFVVGLPGVAALADYLYTDSNGTHTVFSFVCQTTKLCTGFIIMDSTGTEKATSGNPLVTSTTNGALETGGNLASTATNTGTIATAQGVGGTGINQPTGGSGILGWLSGIYNKLGSPMQSSGGSVTANAGTNLNTSSLALESGGNLATAATNTGTTATNTGTTNTDVGPPGATACSSDTGSCSVNALLQRIAQRITSLISALGSPFQAGGSIGNTSFGAIPQPSSSSTNGLSPSTTSALAANQVVKGSAGNLYSFEVSADSTLSAAAWWVMVYNATSAPSDGAVTPAKCYAVPAGQTSASYAWQVPVQFSTGITIGVSTTGCFTKTASTHAFISGDAQ